MPRLFSSFPTPRIPGVSLALAFLSAMFAMPTALAGSGASTFVPGDNLQGIVDVAGDEDTVDFDGLVADKIRLKVKAKAGVTIRVVVRDELGSDVLGFNVKGGKKGKTKKKKVKLTSTGVHTLVVTGLDDTTGDYSVKTSRKLNPLARSTIHNKETAIPSLTYNEQVVAGYPGTLFSAVVIPNNVVEPTALNLGFFDPAGNPINTNAFESTSDIAAHMTYFPLTLLGQHRMRTGGVGDPGAAVDITLILIHPAPSEDPVLID